MIPGISTMQFNKKDRKYGGWIGFCGRTLTKAAIKIDPTLTLSDIPAPVTIDNKWVTAHIIYGATGDTLTAEVELIIRNCMVTLDEIDAYNSDIKRIAKAANMTFVLNSVTQ